MKKPIKYKRFSDKFKIKNHKENIQTFLDKLITDGWRIISYQEKVSKEEIAIVCLCEKYNDEIIL
jgi:hypothetical protein